jgi:uncharacterized protein (DUF305 family)
VNKCVRRFAILLILTFVAVSPALQVVIHAQTDKANAELAWPELMSCMEKMHVAMASAESSGSSDADFVRLMLPHHQAAIDMAKIQLLFGKDPQMRRLAQEIITDQQSEMELLQVWLKRQGPDAHKTGQVSPSGIPKER